MSATFYLAGSSHECRMVSNYVERLTRAGLVCAYDWTADVERNRAIGRVDSDLTSDERRAIAVAELNAVTKCDLFWLLCPESPSRGCWGELCARLVAKGPRGGRSLVSGRHAQSIFCELADEKFDSHEAAYEWAVEEFR